LVSTPPSVPANPADPLDFFLHESDGGNPLSSLSFATLSLFSSALSANFLLNSFVTIFFCFSFFSFNYFYSYIIFLFISKFSSSSCFYNLINSSVKCPIKAAIFLSGLNYLLFPIYFLQRGHSFLPNLLYASIH
jgi:hypothetical protein